MQKYISPHFAAR